jgi:hypothetical protein
MSNHLVSKAKAEDQAALLADDDDTDVQSTGMYRKSSKTSSKSGDLKNQESAPAAGTATASGVNDVPLTIEVFKTFQFKGQKSPQEVLSHAPLVAPLQALNLDPKTPFNVRKIYLRSVSSTSKSPIAVQFKNVNGKHLDKQHHDGDHYTWSTYTEHPGNGTTTSYAHLNDGKGLLLDENELDQYGKLNSRVSVADMWKDVHTHDDWKENGEPTHYVISANFAGYTNPNNTTQAQKASSMSQVAQLVYSNAKHQINNHEEIQKHMPGVELHRLKPGDKTNEVFTDIDVRHDNSGKAKNRFHLIVKADEFNRAMALYGKELDQTPKATEATQHTIEIFRPGQTDPKIEPDTTNTIGNIAGQGGVTTADLDRSKNTFSTVHMLLTYELEHPGTAAAAPK